jgi:ATP-dependent Zn protease
LKNFWASLQQRTINALINVDDETRISRCILFKFFFTRFLSSILTKHRKNRKNNQFSIYSRNYLLFNETTRKQSFIDDDKNLNFKLFINNDLHDSNINIVVFFVIIVNFIVFILFFFFIFFVFFLLRDFFRRDFFFTFFFLLSIKFESNAIFDETRL